MASTLRIMIDPLLRSINPRRCQFCNLVNAFPAAAGHVAEVALRDVQFDRVAASPHARSFPVTIRETSSRPSVPSSNGKEIRM